MRLTGPQIAAGIALAGLSGESVANETGIARSTIYKITAGTAAYRDETMNKIREVLEARGIEFTEQNGVRQKTQGVDMLVGPQGLQHFFDGVYEYAKKHGGTIMQLGIEEDLFWAMGVEFSEAHRKRMTELVKERQDIKVLAILCEGDTNFIASEYNQYRWISKELFSAVPFYIYGEHLAIMNFQTNPAPTIILHKMPVIANAYRKQFEAFWNMSREPDVPQELKQAKPPHIKKEK
jgi:transcriptional regulator with XRE-family HTH domain